MHIRRWTSLLLAVALAVGVGAPAAATDAGDPAVQATTLLDLSGLASIPGVCCKGDAEPAVRLLAAHDAKDPKENDRPRISILTLTGTPEGVTWQPLDLDWSDLAQGPPDDLESAAAIPGTNSSLVVESGDDGSDFRRIFHIEVAADANAARLVEAVEWPVDLFNVEGTAVAAVDDGYLFVYAERAQGEATTMIRWAPMELSPLSFGTFEEAAFTSPAVLGDDDRPVSAMEIATDGSLYVASAHDEDDDDGPFSSTIWLAGQVASGADVAIEVADAPRLIATLDAFKAESLAMVTAADGSQQLYVGTDDENLGGVLRPVPDTD